MLQNLKFLNEPILPGPGSAPRKRNAQRHQRLRLEPLRNHADATKNAILPNEAISTVRPPLGGLPAACGRLVCEELPMSGGWRGQVDGWHGQGPPLEDVHLAMALPGGPCPCWAVEALRAPWPRPTDKARGEALVVVPGVLARALSVPPIAPATRRIQRFGVPRPFVQRG